jgi:hypothetical protein
MEELAATEELARLPFHCPNCPVTFEDVKSSPFCSSLCGEEAHWVRRVRRCMRNRSYYEDPKVKKEIDDELARILGGGYNKKGRKVPKRVRRFVIDRAGGRCEICGGPGTEIHHIHGSSNDPANLQLLCRPCHEKTFAPKISITEESHPEEWAKAQGLKKRAEAPKPLLLCDSEIWKSIWKELMRKRSDAVTGQAGLFE